MKKILSICFLLLGTSACQGGFLFSGTSGSIPGSESNAVIRPVILEVEGRNGVFSLDGLFNSTIGLSSRVKALTFTFYGAEARISNQFFVNTVSDPTPTVPLFEHAGPGKKVVGDGSFVVESETFGVDELDFTDGFFSFNSPGMGTATSDFNSGVIDFFTYRVKGSQKDILLFLDDGGGRSGQGDDDNHDDMVIRITALVPEPGTMSLALCSLAIGGLSFRRRR